MNKKDVQLLSEAYSVQLLKEDFPKLTLRQVVENYDRYNVSQREWVDEFSGRVIEELFGGLGAVGKSIGRGIGNMAKGAARGASNAAVGAAKGLGNAARNAGSAAVDSAKGVGRGVAAAGNQVKKNVGNMYKHGEDASIMAQGEELVQQLQNLIQQAVDKGYITFDQDVMDTPLQEVIAKLAEAEEVSGEISQGFQDDGTFKNVGNAFKRGYGQQPQAQAQAQAQPQGQAATA